MIRTIESLRREYEGKMYIYCSTEEVFLRFLSDAEREGYMIGNKKPTEARISWDIKAIEHDKTISNCGIIGHIACQAGADNVHIIDYERYINGDKDCEVKQI